MFFCPFTALLLIVEYPDHHQSLINSLLYYLGPLRKISSQSVHNFQSNVVHRQTDRQTNTTNNITSFAKVVNIAIYSFYIQMLRSCNTHHIINSLTGYPIGLTGLPY